MQSVGIGADRFRDAYFDQSKSSLARRIQDEKFFHDMVLHDGTRTGSWVYDGESFPPNYHLSPIFRYLSSIDLSSASCIDIGSYDGMTAFVMSELGAREVVATCQFDLPRFRAVRAYQDYQNVAYYPNTELSEFSALFEHGFFDVVVVSAMFHHLTAPLDGLLAMRRLLRPGGLFVFESIALDRDEPAIYLNTELDDPIYGAPTLFVPTLSSLRGLLKLASFDTLSQTQLLGGKDARETNYERFSFVARAVRPSEVSGRGEKAKEIHEKSPKIGEADFDSWESEATALAPLEYRGPRGGGRL